MKVVIRTDASLVMGTGHAVRCLTLAKALRERGATCTFVCREHPGHLLAWMRDQGFAALGLPEPDTSASTSDDPNPLAHASWLGVSMETDARETLEVIGEEQVDWLIVDHYGLDARWESIMRSRCRRIMVIDDLADRPHACELLLDQNLIDGYAERYQDRVPEHVGLMLGPEFALLQPEYRQLHDAVKTRQGTIESVLIYFGGADRDNLTGKVLGAIIALECPQIRVDVVVNTSSPHLESIRKQIEGHPQIKLHQSVPSLAPMMLQADLAIGASGATTWERCCLGLPSLVFTLAENQKPIAHALDRLGLIRWLNRETELDETALVERIGAVLTHPLQPEWSANCQKLVDGRGTLRVVGYLLTEGHSPLRTRLATPEDEDLILMWANDDLVRKNAFFPDKIHPDDHHRWFTKRLAHPDQCIIYVIETEEGLPVGQVRFERSDDLWEIGYALDARLRGRGLGERILQVAFKTMSDSQSPLKLIGRVKKNNIPSKRIFEKLGFRMETTDEAYVFHQTIPSEKD